MFDFLSIAGRCKKSHRLLAYVLGCLTTIIVIAVVSITSYAIVCQVVDNGGYKDFSIHLFGIVEIEGSR
uniref:Uncharacterized protein n=1 Tax=Siphoviridae sp. ctXZx16 TaxID=2826371 RepID=A0A8S5ML31_9CAUD|nr:MAG TPA: hypothetical protein [Siphoviridae sp. ctXZx16]